MLQFRCNEKCFDCWSNKKFMKSNMTEKKTAINLFTKCQYELEKSANILNSSHMRTHVLYGSQRSIRNFAWGKWASMHDACKMAPFSGINQPLQTGLKETVPRESSHRKCDRGLLNYLHSKGNRLSP
jgi:hypothetical protein